MVDLYAYLTSLLMHEDSIEHLDLNVDANLSLKELLKPAGKDSVFASPVEYTLKLFDKLKHLALGAHTLYYYTSETSKDQAEISRSLMVYRRIWSPCEFMVTGRAIVQWPAGNCPISTWTPMSLDLWRKARQICPI
jgi:hypothetical protein